MQLESILLPLSLQNRTEQNRTEEILQSCALSDCFVLLFPPKIITTKQGHESSPDKYDYQLLHSTNRIGYTPSPRY